MQSIDYGHGLTNINQETGIRYGCISQHSLDPDALNEIWTEGSVYLPYCPHCNEANDAGNEEECHSCGKEVEEWEYAEEMNYLRYEEKTKYGKIVIEGCLDSDLIITESPFYTLARLCSPCVPGAGDLDTPDNQFGYKTYCLPADFFEDNKKPYPIMLVGDIKS